MSKIISISKVSDLTGVTLKIWYDEGTLKSKFRTSGGHGGYRKIYW